MSAFALVISKTTGASPQFFDWKDKIIFLRLLAIGITEGFEYLTDYICSTIINKCNTNMPFILVIAMLLKCHSFHVV